MSDRSTGAHRAHPIQLVLFLFGVRGLVEVGLPFSALILTVKISRDGTCIWRTGDLLLPLRATSSCHRCRPRAGWRGRQTLSGCGYIDSSLARVPTISFKTGKPFGLAHAAGMLDDRLGKPWHSKETIVDAVRLLLIFRQIFHCSKPSINYRCSSATSPARFGCFAAKLLASTNRTAPT